MAAIDSIKAFTLSGSFGVAKVAVSDLKESLE
jgi:hypothetical protein